MNPSKVHGYRHLVKRRKECQLCNELENPSRIADGRYDSDHIGPWTIWEGDLDASAMVVGQDWGDVKYFIEHKGLDEPRNPTNRVLTRLLTSIDISSYPPYHGNERSGLFFTNAILCLKKGGLQGKVKNEWFEHCGNNFLRPIIELVHPSVVISLGQKAYEAIQRVFDNYLIPFRRAVAGSEGFPLIENIRLFPMYHCGARILNTHRPFDQQLTDWQRIGIYLKTVNA